MIVLVAVACIAGYALLVGVFIEIMRALGEMDENVLLLGGTIWPLTAMLLAGSLLFALGRCVVHYPLRWIRGRR